MVLAYSKSIGKELSFNEEEKIREMRHLKDVFEAMQLNQYELYMLENFESIWKMIRSLEEELNHENSYFETHCVHMYPYQKRDWFGIWKSKLTITENLILDMRRDVFNDDEYI